MSVCVAALAADSRAVVCVADKALSYGGYIQWDSNSTKMMNLAYSLVMFSDNGNAPRVLAQFRDANFSGKDLRQVVKDCEARYNGATQLLIESTYLRPRLLDHGLYVTAITSPEVNHLIRGLADEISKFDMECDLLVCGFDSSGESFILHVFSPGIVSDQTGTGFQAIGSGAQTAISRLLFNDSKRTDSIERVLYEAFDAKANAEMAVGVGYEWDARILVSGKEPIEVPEKIKNVIEEVWSFNRNSPFGDTDPSEPPQRNWKKVLKNFAEGCLMPSTSQTSAGRQ